MNEGIIIHGYHLLVAFLSLCGMLTAVIGAVHRIWIAPLQAWRAGVNEQIHLLKTDAKLQKQRLDSGTAKFDELTQAIKELTGCVNALKVQLARQEGQA